MSGVRISFRVLWQFVSQYSNLKPKTQVKKLLEENEEFIRDSLSIYADGNVGAPRPASTPAKKSENVKTEFVKRLATFLGLSEGTYLLYSNQFNLFKF